MNYAAAFATALNEDLDERQISKSGIYGVPRVDPSKVMEVHFVGDEGYHYSEYTNADPSADLIFLGELIKEKVPHPLHKNTMTWTQERYTYGHTIDMTLVGRINLGKVMQRAAELMKETS